MKIYALILSLCLMFNMFGCAPIVDMAEPQTDEIVAESIGVTQTNTAQSEETTESVKTYNTQTDNPQEDVKASSKTDYSDMKAHFIDVGQADSVFIELGNGQTVLIDAGKNADANTVINYIKNLRYNSIDYVIATHPHEDHIGGMAKVLDSFDIGRIYMPKKAHTTKTFENMLDAIEKNGIDLYTAKAGTNITTSGPIKIDILAPVSQDYADLNNYSAVVKIAYGETVMLFMGDAEQEVEAQIIGSQIDADVLKVGHHGSSTSSSAQFIKAVTPAVAIISAGKDNSYGHPHAETLEVLKNIGADIYRTDEVGSIIVTADQNKKITVDKKASTIKENAPPIVEKKTVDESKSENEVTNNQSDVVYRTKTGKKYHMSGCSYLKSKIETTVSEAQAMGLEPCLRCNPPR